MNPSRPSLRSALGVVLAAVVALVASMVPAGSSLASASSATAVVRGLSPAVLAWRLTAPATQTIGYSQRGRAIVAHRQGSPDAAQVVLIVGQMHGSEPRGVDVVREVRQLIFPKGVQVWTISTMNPDGFAAHTRANARHVDLNRNFPHLWKPNPKSATYFPGVRAASESETQAVMAFLDELRPDVVVSLHQAFRAVDLGPPKAQRWIDVLSAATGLPIKNIPCNGECRGTMTGWFNSTFVGAAITVELPRHVSHTQAKIYARAIRSLASALVAPPLPVPSPSVSPSGSATPSVTPVPTVTTAPTLSA